MALIPKIKMCLASDCSTLTFSELTGAYNATTNTGGYGATNSDIIDIVQATLTVIDPSDNSYTIDMYITGDFPTTNTDFTYTINLEDIDKTSIEDGYWQFIYTVLDDDTDTVYSTTTSYYFYCNSECCVSKLLTSIDIEASCSDKINNDKIKNYNKARILLESLKNAGRCFNTSAFDNIKSLISKICKNTNCKTCN